jgi:hypothetical protein
MKTGAPLEKNEDHRTLSPGSIVLRWRDEKAMTTHASATTTERTFRMDCSIRCDIAATPDRIWAFLTDAAGFPNWNSTVTSLKGNIALGQKLELKVRLDPKRVFTPKVTKLEENRAMEWSDGMAPMFKGIRHFALTPKGNGMTEFQMTEVFSGLMLPMIKGSLPDFRPAFEAYAADLKRAAEGTV